MSLLTPTPVSSRLFTPVRQDDDLILVAEASDLPGRGRLGRVWNDACDVGLTVISQATGNQVVFCEEEHRRDAEGEWMWTDLRPAERSDRARFPNLIVRIYND